MKLTSRQLGALRLVWMWSKDGAYMPSMAMRRTFEAAERKGALEWRSVDQGSRYNGYALTPAGRALLTTKESGNG